MALVDDIADRVARKRRDDVPAVDLAALTERILPACDAMLRQMQATQSLGIDGTARGVRAEAVSLWIDRFLAEERLTLNPLQRRNLVTTLLNQHYRQTTDAAPAFRAPVDTISGLVAETSEDTQPVPPSRSASQESVEAAAATIRPLMMEEIDVAAAAELDRASLAQEISAMMPELLASSSLRLNALEQRDLITLLVNDMLGLGPLEKLLADAAVTDILVNGPNQIYVERGGKLVLSDIVFRDDRHVMMVATRIVSRIGRRIDESSPMCDARLADGSRVNIIIPPLAIDGPSISIRKFSEKKITLQVMASQGNISPAMETVLQVAARARLNIIISGGTGSGKTTLLNALSRMIDVGERIVTIEDAAELQLQQPHVVRLETRPANLEGQGEITMRDLLKNSLRMRPDRIILGEVRGSEAIDMLQAMNTGHEGSMCTVHANNPREALTRLENMVGMAGINLPAKAIRTQIAAAVEMIVQVSRMRDGMRRITSVTEVVGMEGDVITTQELFAYRFEGEGDDGRLLGRFDPAGLRPASAEKAAYFGLEKSLLRALS